MRLTTVAAGRALWLCSARSRVYCARPTASMKAWEQMLPQMPALDMAVGSTEGKHVLECYCTALDHLTCQVRLVSCCALS